MGWKNCHLWEFWDGVRGPGTVQIGPIPPSEMAAQWFDSDGQRHSVTVRLPEVLTAVGQKLLYTYDMGDNWEHQLLVEAIGEVADGAAPAAPQCLTGRRAAPPEDCGGLYGYYDILELLDSKKRRPAHLKGYDPAAFDKAAANEALAKMAA